jgi:hypothetical protein
MLDADEEHGHTSVSKDMGILLQDRTVFNHMSALRQTECVRQITSLLDCHPENESLILMWMTKHFEGESMVQWQLVYAGVMKGTPEGKHIEYVINALAKVYADPDAVSTVRTALKQLK